MCVRDDRLLFEVSAETMSSAWREEVEQKVGIKKDALHSKDEPAVEPRGLEALHPCKKVHAFVLLQMREDQPFEAKPNWADEMKCMYLGFVKKMNDPAAVMADFTE